MEIEFMEALRDRTVKIDIPYITRLSEEIKIYNKDFNAETVPHIHVAPHTLEMCAMWAVLTRLEEPKHAGLTRLQKLKLYNGKTLPGFTEENINELREHARQEGMIGISPRYVQDKISNALVAHPDARSINPFMVMNELESGLKHHALIGSEDKKREYRELLSVVKQDYEDMVKNEVQRAISADEDSIAKLCANYIDNIKAKTGKSPEDFHVAAKKQGLLGEPFKTMVLVAWLKSECGLGHGHAMAIVKLLKDTGALG